MLTEEENVKRIAEDIDRILADSDKSIFVVIDGDRTLIPVDSTKYFFKYLNIDFLDIKNIFQQHGYSFEAFFHVAKYYSKIQQDKYCLACGESASQMSIYPEFLSFINTIKDKAELILVTSGVSQNWQCIINNHSLDFMHLIGGSYFPLDNYVVDRNAKGIIINCIKKKNKKVFAFGDSLIDLDMLEEADHGYLVVNEKMNKDVIPLINLNTKMEQISFSKTCHEKLRLSSLDKISILIHNYYMNDI